MKKKIFLLLAFISLFLACPKNDEIKALFHRAEAMENDILKNIATIAECKKSYEQIIIKAPDSEYAPKACYKLGKLNEIFEHYDEALDYYQKLLTVYPESPLAGEVLFAMAQIYHLHTDKWEQAISAYSQFVGLFPDAKQALHAFLNMAEIYYQKEQWEAALETYQCVLDKYPNHQICQSMVFRLADIYKFKLKNEAKAQAEYQFLMKSYPNSSWSALANQRLMPASEGEKNHEK